MKKWLVCVFSVLLSGCVTLLMQQENYWALTSNVLEKMNQAYMAKNFQDFSSYVAPETVFNRDDFLTAVQNDFAGFVTVEYETKIRDLRFFKNEGQINQTVEVLVEFSRSAFTYRYGTSLEMGETLLTFEMTPQKQFFLKDMGTPLLYGLVAP